MNPPDVCTGEGWSYSVLHQIDLLCDQFEQNWNDGQKPAITEVIAKYSELPRGLIVFELVRLEIHLRLRAGDTPSKSEYLEKLTQDGYIIEKVWKQEFGLPTGAQPTADHVPDTTTESRNREPIVVPGALGPLQIQRQLGEGGFGVVYLATSPDFDDVALKIPAQAVQQSPAHRRRVIEEAQVGKSLDHPNLVRTFEVQEISGYVVIIQEYIDGTDLSEWYRANTPGGVEIGRVFIPIAQALGHLHERGFVHRDLKPANILVDRSGIPHVTDFGLALHEDVQRHRKWELGGTWPYMSPEQIRRQSHLIDGQSDIWSLGVILYKLLTGRLPFGGPIPNRRSDAFTEYLQELEFEITEHDPRPPRMVCPGISRTLEKICLRCLEKRKRDRFRTASDLADELQLYTDKLHSNHQSAPHTPARVVPKGLHSFGTSDADFFMDLLPGPRTSAGIPASLNFWRY